MQTFVLGIMVGGAVVGTIAALVFINTKLKTIIAQLHVLTAKIARVEKISETTMMAAENFVEALQSSAEQMVMRPIQGPPQSGSDDFSDLRETFEEGIRNLEEDSDDEEDGWKKGT